jgi:hypothetical protein
MMPPMPTRVRASRRMRTGWCALMLRDAAPSRVEDARERARGAAPQHEGRRGRLLFTGSCATQACEPSRRITVEDKVAPFDDLVAE